MRLLTSSAESTNIYKLLDIVAGMVYHGVCQSNKTTQSTEHIKGLINMNSLLDRIGEVIETHQTKENYNVRYSDNVWLAMRNEQNSVRCQCGRIGHLLGTLVENGIVVDAVCTQCQLLNNSTKVHVPEDDLQDVIDMFNSILSGLD